MASALQTNCTKTQRKDSFFSAALLLLLPFITYLPAIKGGFIWDDNVMLTENPYIKGSDGLKFIWFSTRLTDYLPLTSTSLWVEWRLWGMNPAGYRITNILLHGLSAVMLWRVLRVLNIPGAWLAGAIFAVHPVCAASVAWISERKNTLSMLLYLVALKYYLVAPRSPIWNRPYLVALIAFVLALLSKSSVVMLPVVLLGITLWRDGRLTRGDSLRTAPFFGLSLGFGLLTIWFQFHRSLGEATADTLNLAGKTIAATWALWFYLGKSIWPLDLAMIYPQWKVDVTSLLSYLPFVAIVCAIGTFWKFRATWGRHALLATFYFTATLFPVLGFFDMYFLTFSRVADHWQYLALLGVIVPAAGILASVQKRFAPLAAVLSSTAVICVLAFLTWNQAQTYKNSETLWRHTLSLNPDCWPAHNNLGRALDESGKTEEAIEHYQKAVRLNPRFSKAHHNLAIALEKLGRIPEAEWHFKETLRLDPKHVISMNHLGNTAAQQGKAAEAIAHYEQALAIQPDFAEAHNNLGNVLASSGNLDSALNHYRHALQSQPEYVEAHNNLAFVLSQRGDADSAAVHFRKAIALRPTYVQAHLNFATMLLSRGRLDEAKASFQTVIQLAPTAEAHYNLALILVEQGDRIEAAEHFKRALQLRPDFPEAHRELEALSVAAK